MGLKDNFSQAFKELTNPKEAKDQAKPEIKDVASYMNDKEEEAAQAQPAEEVADTAATTNQPQATAAEQQPAPNMPNPQSIAQNYYQQQNNQQFQQQNNQQFQQQNNQQFQQQNNQQFQQNNQQNNNAYGGPGFQQNPAPAAVPNSFGYSEAMRQENSETTIISKNTIIDGNVRSFADMKIDGSIKGSVETTKNVNINGKVVGNITCDNAIMRASSIQGNVTLKGQATMSSESMLIGDLTSQVATLNGKMKGNLTVTGKAQLDREAVIFGDIKAAAISISDGAIIQGYISTTYLSQDESSNIFPESIAIGE